jgi:hypothetical protein
MDGIAVKGCGRYFIYQIMFMGGGTAGFTEEEGIGNQGFGIINGNFVLFVEFTFQGTWDTVLVVFVVAGVFEIFGFIAVWDTIIVAV